jgi:adenylate cyclase
MALIWSFHVQYQQPPSFYLKVPTLLYIFIFIALRALRFRARFVVAAGLMAATGWLAMIAYVVFSDPVDNMVTRDYIHYLTSNSILLGAEFDKVISILMVTAVLALVLRRGRRLLVQAVAEQAAAQDLSRFFDASVATRIRDTDDRIVAGDGVVRQAAVLNVDIRGFTILAAAMEPGEVMKLLAEYQSRMVPVIQACNGTIDKFLGDGVMATFGAAAVSDTCAADALRAIDAVIASAADWAAERQSQGLTPLVINASVAAGPIVFGAVGDANRLEYTVIGAAVNLSAKLEKFNKDLGVAAVTTSDTFDMAVTQGYEPGRPCETRTGRIPGVAGEQSIVVLHG